MAEHDVGKIKKQEKVSRKTRLPGNDPKPLLEKPKEQTPSLIGETPFRPQSERHAALLNGASSDTERAKLVSGLQRTYGNRYVQRLIKSINIQPKLTVGAANDPYEHEADQVADRVMSMTGPTASQPSANNHGSAQRQTPQEEEKPVLTKLISRIDEEDKLLLKPITQRQSVPEEEEEPVQTKLISRIDEEDELLLKPLAQRQSVPEEEEEPVQTKLISRIDEEDELLLKPLTQRQSVPEEKEILQSRPIIDGQPVDPSGSFDAGSNVEQAIQSQLGGGSPLPGEVRSFMEPRFGADFSNVHVHTGSDASQLNREISAQAFTHGQDIFMGEGKYSPGTGEGKKLLAHELTHVVQQTGVVKRRKPNVASLAKIAPLSNVQRASSTGLAAAKVTGEFAKEAFNYWTDKANAGEPLTSLSDFLIDKVNAKLSYSCQRGYATSGSAGAFSRVTWTITVNTADFSQRPGITKVGDLNQNEVAEIVDTIYHEARHSEQYFRIAKMKAGEKKSADDITKEMSIPKDVAEAAVKSPLKGDVKANKTLIAEAKVWEQITVGKYGEYKGKTSSLGDDVVKMYEEAAKNYPKISDQMNNLAPMITKVETQLTSFFEEEKGKIEKIKKKDGFDKTVLKHIIQIRSAFDKLKAEFDKQRIEASASKDATKYKYNIPKLQELVIKLYNVRYKAYRDFQHEKDTWAVGGAAAKAFKKLKVKK